MSTRAVLRAFLALIVSATALLATPACASSQPSSVQPARVAGTTVIATDLTSPWGLAFLPDGSALVTERDTKRVLRIRPGAAKPVRVVGTVDAAVPYGEGGLLGIAVPPGPSPRSVYVYYSTANDNRIARIAWDGRRLGRSTVILSGIPHGMFHNGGRLAFGPDGMLYASTGDTTNSALAQDVSSLGGKVLRMTPFGKRPADNPFPRSLVWTLGHRNVQGLAFDAKGRLYATEFGQKDVDELNILRKGGNYGWPIHEGASGDKGFVNPIAQWSPTSTASPSGVAIAGSSAYVAALAGQRLYRVPLNGSKAGKPVTVPLGDLGRVRTVALAPNGTLWVMTSNTDGRAQPKPNDDRILEVRLAG